MAGDLFHQLGRNELRLAAKESSVAEERIVERNVILGIGLRYEERGKVLT